MGRGLTRNYADQDRPQPIGYCDRCNHRYWLSDLHWQHDWRGPKLANLRMLVCNTCEDQPYNHAQPIVIPPDPRPIRNPRPGYVTQQAGPQPAPFFPFAPFESVPPFVEPLFDFLTDDLGNVITDDLGKPIMLDRGQDMGPPPPPPPPADLFAFLMDDQGNVITDDQGNPIMIEAGGGGPTPITPSDGQGNLDFSDPDNTQFLPVIS